MIVANKIKCSICQDTIQSKHKHDFVWCSCGSCAVDGGLEYLKRVGNQDNYEELSISYSDTIETIRENFVWGRNYDADMNHLKETEWILLKDITDDHLDALMEYKPLGGSKVQQIFNREKQYRCK